MTEQAERREWKCRYESCGAVLTLPEGSPFSADNPECPFCGSEMVDPSSPAAWLHREVFFRDEARQRLLVTRVDSDCVYLEPKPISYRYDLDAFRAALDSGTLEWLK